MNIKYLTYIKKQIHYGIGDLIKGRYIKYQLSLSIIKWAAAVPNIMIITSDRTRTSYRKLGPLSIVIFPDTLQPKLKFKRWPASCNLWWSRSTSDNHCLTTSHWLLSHIPHPGFQLKQCSETDTSQLQSCKTLGYQSRPNYSFECVLLLYSTYITIGNLCCVNG